MENKKDNGTSQMVMARKAMQEKKRSKNQTGDNSPGKERLHTLVKELLYRFGDKILSNLYTRTELEKMCLAYRIQTRETKVVVGNNLSEKIKTLAKIPYPWSLVQDSIGAQVC